MIPEIVIKIKKEISDIETEYRKKINTGTISEDEKNYLMGIIHAETIIDRICRESDDKELD